MGACAVARVSYSHQLAGPGTRNGFLPLLLQLLLTRTQRQAEPAARGSRVGRASAGAQIGYLEA
jgi:hypothetical protein